MERETQEYEESKTSDDTIAELYPTINDANFANKIAKRKEFADTKYIGDILPIEDQSNLLCNAVFELMPHQIFVKNFLSYQTPYNSLLLYHGLGSGKTCSAIGIAEEMRNYTKQIGIVKRIIVVASPNVQGNFRTQLFDEDKLRFKDGEYNLRSCIGNSLIDEINPTHLKGLTREKVITQIRTIINTHYDFMGYTEFANYITKNIQIPVDAGFTDAERKIAELRKIRQHFDHRLVIVDEVQNIHPAEDNRTKRTAALLQHVAKNARNMRLLLLSATPMYNSYKEIVWLTNLLNANDKREPIKIEDVFDKEGTYRESRTSKDGTPLESGKELLYRKLTGYVSYVRGENPYTFPYRIYPDIFSPENTISTIEYPKVQMNQNVIVEPIQHIPIYMTRIGEYQSRAYASMIRNMMEKTSTTNMPAFEELDSFGYTLLVGPIESLNMIYPSEELEEVMDHFETTDNKDVVISSSIGKTGLSNVVTYKTVTEPNPLRYGFKYKKGIEHQYGRIFSPGEIRKYSHKIAEICDCIKRSNGIILVYSQYIDGGIIPMALALEEMGFARFGSAGHTKNLFDTPPPISPIDSLTMKTRDEIALDGSQVPFRQARYVMITGDKDFSPNNMADVKYASSLENARGEFVKVILISKAAAEGLDFKCIRQVHIMDPWYNMSRIEQIIGRSVRNQSHCALPFKERNVEIYMHGTILDSAEESADLYVYRVAEKKAKKIGTVTRLLKEIAVDCHLNIAQTNFTEEKLYELPENKDVELVLSSGKTVNYKVGDKPHTDLCDYMDNCAFTCSTDPPSSTEGEIVETYNTGFMQNNVTAIEKRIRELFKERILYKKEHFIQAINIRTKYPLEHIYYVITRIKDIVDPYGRSGSLILKGDYYAFQPAELTDETISTFERSVPIDYKREFLVMDVPKTFETHNDQVEDAKEERNYDAIVNTLKEEMGHLHNTQLKITSTEENWFKQAQFVVNILVENHGFTIDQINRYAIEHAIDCLSFEDRIVLLSRLSEDVFTPIEQIMKDYFQKRMVIYASKTGVVLANIDKIVIYIQSKEDPKKWSETEPEDYMRFSEKMDDFIVKRDEIRPIFGFMQSFKGKKVVFKVKDLSQKRNNNGVKCTFMNMIDVIRIIHNLSHRTIYNVEKTDIKKPGFAVILEMLLRRDEGEKMAFFGTEFAILNRVDKI